jgi:hypothetical protein
MKYSLLLLFLAVVLFGVNAWGFTVPEALTYELSVGGVAVGNLSLEAKDDGAKIRLESTISTLSWVSVFYVVDDQALSSLKKNSGKGVSKNFPYLPATYQLNLHEGPYNVATASVFDHRRKMVSCSDFLENRRTSINLKEGTLDLLSIMYYMRTLPLKPGKPVVMNVYHNKQIHAIELRVVGRQKINIPSGSYQTIMVKANMYYDGFGVINFPGDVFLWLTDDERRTPVLIEKKLPLLTEGKLPAYVMEKMPDSFKKKLSSGSVKATLMR